MIKIILLDVDGVLVQPKGYRAALRATVHHFVGSPIDIPEDTLIDLEKRGISSEWDMCPLLLASYWDDILLRQPVANLPADVSIAATEIYRQRQVDFAGRFVIPDFAVMPGQYPAGTALHAGHFTSIPDELRKNLLLETRNVHKSHTMRVFQHFTLGSKQFTETYDLPAELETDSFLLIHDVANINEEIRQRLCQPDCYPVAFTSRPSKPPCEVKDLATGYAPEAELALQLVSLPNIPIMAFGKLEYLAARYGLDPVSLVKPSPFHALTAVLAAWTRDEWLALQSAHQWREAKSLPKAFHQLPRAFELIVVEDTIGGIQAVRAAGEILKEAGLNVNIRPIGLTSGNAAKSSAFALAGVQSVPDWESLMTEIGR